MTALAWGVTGCSPQLPASAPTIPHSVRSDAAGGLDASFGTAGVAHLFFKGGVYTNALAVQADGRILIAGTYFRGRRGDDFFVARMMPDGQPDPSFGEHGAVMRDFGGNEEATAVAVQADGKILVAGTRLDSRRSQNFTVLRLLENGQVDESFGARGVATSTFYGSFNRAYGMRVQADGKIVVAGYAMPGRSSHFAVVRFTPEGELDVSFGRYGQVTTDFSESLAMARDLSADVAYGLELDEEGRIVLAGLANSSGEAADGFAMVRYLENGRLDRSFGRRGMVFHRLGDGNVARAVTIQTDGKMVLAGVCDKRIAVARYTDIGEIDEKFGDGGVIREAPASVAGGSDMARAVVSGETGEIYVASTLKGGLEVSLRKYGALGKPDPCFGDLTCQRGGEVRPTGSFLTQVGKDHGIALVRQPDDGRVLVAISSDDGFTVHRYHP
ncbi:MAG: hypothetical protein AB7P04_01825 [Bacteriovoracia bacterium]